MEVCDMKPNIKSIERDHIARTVIYSDSARWLQEEGKDISPRNPWMTIYLIYRKATER